MDHDAGPWNAPNSPARLSTNLPELGSLYIRRTTNEKMEPATTETAEYAPEMSREEARGLFESETQRLLGMCAEEFVEKYESGFWPDADAVPGVVYLTMVRQFAE